jgi:anti-sigma B factor antagonist
MSKENLQVVSEPGARDGQRVVHLKGSLNIHTVFGFQDAMRKENVPELIIDFSGVPYIDSAGLGALVSTYVGTQKAMRKLAFTGMNTQVKALMEMTHVDTLLKTYASVKDAEAAFSSA